MPDDAEQRATPLEAQLRRAIREAERSPHEAPGGAAWGVERDRLVADAAALARLAETPEWQVLDRLIGEHLGRLLTRMRARGLGGVETEALRAEADALEWLRNRPAALRRAVEDFRAMEAQHTAVRRPDHPAGGLSDA
jgi:hypothetical protein